MEGIRIDVIIRNSSHTKLNSAVRSNDEMPCSGCLSRLEQDVVSAIACGNAGF